MHSCDTSLLLKWILDRQRGACRIVRKESQPRPPHGPRILRASCMSRCMMVTRLACIAQRFLGVEHKGKGRKLGESRTRPQRDGRGRPPSPPARPVWRSSASARLPRPSDSWCQSSYPARSREPVVMSARGERDGAATYDAREGEFPEEEVGATLVLANLAERERARTIAAFLALSGLLGGI